MTVSLLHRYLPEWQVWIWSLELERRERECRFLTCIILICNDRDLSSTSNHNKLIPYLLHTYIMRLHTLYEVEVGNHMSVSLLHYPLSPQ